MIQERRDTLRRIMSLAWELWRNAQREGNPRTFADALAGAWRWNKRLAAAPKPAWAAGTGARVVVLRSPLQSPIRRALSDQPHANWRDRKASYLSSRLGG